MASDVHWQLPSPNVRALIQSAAQRLLALPESEIEEIDAVTTAGADPAIIRDPALMAAIRRANRANLTHWLEANVHDPGARVPPNLGVATFSIARDLVRRGLDQMSLDAYRTGQNAAWRFWMAAAFSLTTDPGELAELLDVTARSIFDFVDQTIAAIADDIRRERDQLTRGTQAERLEVVTLVLSGAPIAADRASLRLGYELSRIHTAAIIFSDAADPDRSDLEQAAESLARAAGARRPLTVVASASALWTWVSSREALDLAGLRAALSLGSHSRIALGPSLPGVDGFRRSHVDALATQRLLQRVPDDVRLATYDEVGVVTLATHDGQSADEFVRRTLGSLADASVDVREALRVYLREGHNTTRTAQVLFTHRNTVVNRLSRAEQLLPDPLAGRSLQVGLALEINHWLGPRR
jgi:DNA-binding PucR family transcriptional regulator